MIDFLFNIFEKYYLKNQSRLWLLTTGALVLFLLYESNAFGSILTIKLIIVCLWVLTFITLKLKSWVAILMFEFSLLALFVGVALGGSYWEVRLSTYALLFLGWGIIQGIYEYFKEV